MNVRATMMRIATCAAVAIAVTITGCDDDPAQPAKGGTFYGPSVTLGDGKARSYVVLNNDGKPTELGLAMSEAAMNNLPAGHDHGHGPSEAFTLLLPKEAAATPFNHIGLDWNPMGHEPAQIYDKPHFDVHFYMISQQDRDKITAVGADTLKLNAQPPAQYAPMGYIGLPGGVPRMGAHWVDPMSPELHGQSFTKTFIYGFYDASMIFMEPMITKAFLEGKSSTTDSLKLPQAYQKSGYYPTTYTVRFNESTKEYLISLTNMVAR